MLIEIQDLMTRHYCNPHMMLILLLKITIILLNIRLVKMYFQTWIHLATTKQVNFNQQLLQIWIPFQLKIASKPIIPKSQLIKSSHKDLVNLQWTFKIQLKRKKERSLKIMEQRATIIILIRFCMVFHKLSYNKRSLLVYKYL